MWKRNEKNEIKWFQWIDLFICELRALDHRLCLHRYESIWVVTQYVFVCSYVCIYHCPLSCKYSKHSFVSFMNNGEWQFVQWHWGVFVQIEVSYLHYVFFFFWEHDSHVHHSIYIEFIGLVFPTHLFVSIQLYVFIFLVTFLRLLQLFVTFFVCDMIIIGRQLAVLSQFSSVLCQNIAIQIKRLFMIVCVHCIVSHTTGFWLFFFFLSGYSSILLVVDFFTLQCPFCT